MVTIPLKLSTLLLFSGAIILVVIIISIVNYYVVAGAANNNNNNSIGRPNPSALIKVIIPYKYVPHVMIFDLALFVVTLILRKGKIM
jgi:hypothetical protein